MEGAATSRAFFTHVTAAATDPSYDIPPGRSEKSIDLSPAISGQVLGLGGHLHRYGVSLRLEDVTEGRLLWEKEATRSLDGDILVIPYDRFVWSGLPTLRPDHTYRVTAVYDNPTGATIVGGGMGTMGGVLIPEEPWPEVNRQSPEYRWYFDREAGSQSESEVTPLGR